MKRKTCVAIIGLVCASAGLYVFLARPYLTESEVRVAGGPDHVRLNWFVACEQEHYKSSDGRHYQPVAPTGGRGIGEMPGEKVATLLGNTFDVVGYRYRTVRTNVLTGHVTEEPSERIDVVGWSIEVPYQMYDSATGETVEKHEPVSWTASEVNPVFSEPVRTRANSDCGRGK